MRGYLGNFSTVGRHAMTTTRITETITASLSAATVKRPATGESIAADLRAAGFMILNRSQVEAGIREIVDGVSIDLGPYAGIVGPLARRIADVFERVEGHES